MAKAGSTGPAFLHTDVRVIDEKGQDVEVGEVGEVIVRGRHVMKEYWNRPDATAETLRDGWLYTGDLASCDEDGYVYITGRTDDVINAIETNIVLSFVCSEYDILLLISSFRINKLGKNGHNKKQQDICESRKNPGRIGG